MSVPMALVEHDFHFNRVRPAISVPEKPTVADASVTAVLKYFSACNRNADPCDSFSFPKAARQNKGKAVTILG